MFPGEHLTLLSDQSPTSGVTVTFAAIPQTYDDLLIKIIAGRSDKVSGNNDVLLYYNNDTTAARYWYTWIRTLATTFSGNEANTANIFRIAGQNIQAPSFGNIWIPRYADSGVSLQQARCEGVIDFKTSFTAGALHTWQVFTHMWNSTAAVTEIDLTLNSDAWATPSRVLLYGVSYNRP